MGITIDKECSIKIFNRISTIVILSVMSSKILNHHSQCNESINQFTIQIVQCTYDADITT